MRNAPTEIHHHTLTQLVLTRNESIELVQPVESKQPTNQITRSCHHMEMRKDVADVMVFWLSDRMFSPYPFMGLWTSVGLLLPNYHQGSKQKTQISFSVPWFLTHEKHSSFLSRSKRAESNARGQINYPRQPFPLSSASDTPEKSGPYQRLQGPSASQASHFPPFYFTITLQFSFSFPKLLSLYPVSLYPVSLDPFSPSFPCSFNL